MPPDPVDPDAALWASQRTLSDFADWTDAEVGTTNGYIESVEEAKSTSVTLLWAGPPNATQAAVLAEAQRRTITATVVRRQYTKDQLNQATDAAWASADSGSGVFANFTIGTATAISSDFDGVVITGLHKSNPADTVAADQALSQQATQVLGVAVKVQTAALPIPSATSRTTDTPAYNAGGYMYPGCSTGFALRYSGANYTTMARHCTSYYRPYDMAWVSTISTKFDTKDGAAKLLNATGSALMFYGNYKSTLKATVVKDPTTGSGRNVNPGSYVCTSGGNSGTHCGGGANQQVIGSTVWNDGKGRVSMLYADRVDGGLAAVDGDSGGPVYQNKTATQVYAVGMIQAVQTGPGLTAPCGATRNGATFCSRRVLYTSINTIIRSVPGSSLVTG